MSADRGQTALRKLRQRLSTTEHMARWKEDLGERLWRAEIASRQGSALYDIAELEAEVALFDRTVKALEAKYDADAQ